MHLKRCLVVVLILALLLGIVPTALAYNMPYYIHVDLTNQIVTVYNTADDSIARQMLCSAGIGDKTPVGEWIMPNKERDDERTEWYWMPNAYTWVKYATKIYYAYFFHSIPYTHNVDGAVNQTALAQFGRPASHGCIRLREEDAEFIAKQCRAGTYVKIFRSGVEDNNLRALLYEKTYIQSEEESYSEFLGFSENDLGRTRSGSDVLDLQYRLTDLGYYSGELDGLYGDSTVAAMTALQSDLGLLTTGICTEALLGVIYSDEAPARAGSVTLSEGQSGPVVKKLQTVLQELLLYQGAIDGVYDMDVAAAVASFQRMFGVQEDGVATPEIQHALYYVANRMHQALGDEEATVTTESEDMLYGTIFNEKANIVVRQKASTESNRLATLEHGDRVLVMAVSGDWAQISGDFGVGYIYKRFLQNPETTQNHVMTYTTASGKTFTLGATLAQKAAGAVSIVKEFQAAYAGGETAQYMHDTVIPYATVNTGDDDLLLNLRAAASADAPILDKAANGSQLRILDRGEEWSAGIYNSQVVYLLSQYLEFWQGDYDDLEDVVASQHNGKNVTSGKALVVLPSDDVVGAKIYAASTESSSIFAHVPANLELTVLSYNAETGWALVQYGNSQGFMRTADLQLI